MSIFDVLLDTPDIVVLGPPQQIDLSLDIGSQGERGSRFFVGTGNPNNPGVLPGGETFILGDVFLNASTGAEFAWLYVYVQSPTGNIWQPALKVQPGIYNRHIDATFNSNGIATISVPLSEISPDSTIVDVNRYVIQVTPVFYANPISLTINSKIISGSNLQFVVEAVEYFSSSWQNLEGVVELGVTISVV
jgi:hypothetical protein